MDAFARYKITEPLKFYQKIGTRLQFDNRLSDFVNSSLRQVLSDKSVDDVVRDKREELLHTVTEIVRTRSQEFGVDVKDVRIKRADLPHRSRSRYREPSPDERGPHALARTDRPDAGRQSGFCRGPSHHPPLRDRDGHAADVLALAG